MAWQCCSATVSVMLVLLGMSTTWLAHSQESLPEDSHLRIHVSTKLRHSRHLGAKQTNHSLSTSLDAITIQDNHKPIFTNCSLYQPVLREQEPRNTWVLRVRAEDQDPSTEGGTVSYSFVRSPLDRAYFFIDEHSGDVTTRHVFDRDEPSREKEAYVTVRATDNGIPKLDDVCTFKVTIEDVNDNVPMFDKVRYQESVPQDLKVGQEVMRIAAVDIDDGNNSIITYELEPTTPDAEFFRIDSHSGIIYLNKPIDKPPQYKFSVQATATDHGIPSQSRSLPLEILVIESNKKSPTIEQGVTIISVPENYSQYDTPILTVRAQSNVDDSPKLQFKINSGVTEQSNSLNTFRLEVRDNIAFIKLAKQLDYESVTEYILNVRVENKYSLAAQQQFTVRVTDVNDNIPAFTKFETGFVLENEPVGTPVMQVRAIDADGTTANNQVKYELGDNEDIFAIDPNTGTILTKKEFDREKQDNYIVKVYAYDNSESALLKNGQPNQGEQTYKIEIADKNDNKPVFIEKNSIASIAEDSNTNSLVTEVKAVDVDAASRLSYSIVGGNIGNAFIIEPTTGKVRVNNQLDYEVTTSYILTVRVHDGIFSDETQVKINIEDVNDNPPVFVVYNNTLLIQEESILDHQCIFNISAYDPDIPDRNAPQNIMYAIVKEDQKKLLSISTSGCLSLMKPLDRDPPNGFERWQVYIVAEDQNRAPSSSQKSTTEVIIFLEDINDNAPFLDIQQPVIWKENALPGKIVTLKAKDYDSEKNGSPFIFKLVIDEEMYQNFYLDGNDLYTKVQFDREERKNYYLPITITDNGEPQKTGTGTLTLVIGDVNDNKMEDGKSSILVYNYKGQSPNIEIGRVYVNDPDDWDLPDKHFQWKDESHPNFKLDSATGMVTMMEGTNNGSYLLEFIVTEESTLIPSQKAFATINVIVKEIPEEAIDKSGSIRFYGITAEEFVSPSRNHEPSRKQIFHNKLASLLNVSVENIDVFTVLHSPHHDSTKFLDVRFSVHGSLYYQPEALNAFIAMNKDEIEANINVKILMINIDECLNEKAFCEMSCSNILNKSSIPYAVYTNLSSFVGVRAFVEPQCICKIPEFTCFNGGTQLIDRCGCLDGFEGPHCEIISIGFYGNGYALYPTFDACDEANFSLEIIPDKDNGLVFYIGPVHLSPTVKDFMALYILHGYLRLLVDYGSGTVAVNQNHIKIEPGKHHFIEILWTRTSIELKVDKCQMSSCLSLTVPQGPNEFLNVNGPLQLGGTFVDIGQIGEKLGWKEIMRMEGFSGCIQNVTFNHRTYNLGNPSAFKNVDPGCNRALAKAVSFGINTNFLVAFLICIAIFLILILAVIVQHRKTDDLYKDFDDIRENIVNYEDEGGGEGDMTGYDLNILRCMYNEIGPNHKTSLKEDFQKRDDDYTPVISDLLDNKKKVIDKDPETNPFDDVRHYAYEGDGNTSGSLSSLSSDTDDGDLNLDYLPSFGPRFQKLADMYGEHISDEDEVLMCDW